jgi:hypothetical protein
LTDVRTEVRRLFGLSPSAQVRLFERTSDADLVEPDAHGLHWPPVGTAASLPNTFRASAGGVVETRGTNADGTARGEQAPPRELHEDEEGEELDAITGRAAVRLGLLDASGAPRLGRYVLWAYSPEMELAVARSDGATVCGARAIALKTQSEADLLAAALGVPGGACGFRAIALDRRCRMRPPAGTEAFYSTEAAPRLEACATTLEVLALRARDAPELCALPSLRVLRVYGTSALSAAVIRASPHLEELVWLHGDAAARPALVPRHPAGALARDAREDSELATAGRVIAACPASLRTLAIGPVRVDAALITALARLGRLETLEVHATNADALEQLGECAALERVRHFALIDATQSASGRSATESVDRSASGSVGSADRSASGSADRVIRRVQDREDWPAAGFRTLVLRGREVQSAVWHREGPRAYEFVTENPVWRGPREIDVDFGGRIPEFLELLAPDACLARLSLGLREPPTHDEVALALAHPALRHARSFATRSTTPPEPAEARALVFAVLKDLRRLGELPCLASLTHESPATPLCLDFSVADTQAVALRLQPPAVPSGEPALRLPALSNFYGLGFRESDFEVFTALEAARNYALRYELLSTFKVGGAQTDVVPPNSAPAHNSALISPIETVVPCVALVECAYADLHAVQLELWRHHSSPEEHATYLVLRNEVALNSLARPAAARDAAAGAKGERAAAVALARPPRRLGTRDEPASGAGA